MTCDHTRLVTNPVIVSHDWDGNAEYELREEEESAFEDLDLHRYRCSLCGQIEYYSSSARLFFEQGVESPELGLTLFTLLKHHGIIPRNWRD